MDGCCIILEVSPRGYNNFYIRFLGRQLVRPGDKPCHALWACGICSSQNYLQSFQHHRDHIEPMYTTLKLAEVYTITLVQLSPHRFKHALGHFLPQLLCWANLWKVRKRLASSGFEVRILFKLPRQTVVPFDHVWEVQSIETCFCIFVIMSP